MVSILPHRLPAVLFIVVGLAAASVTWVKVAQTLTTVEPVTPPTRPSALVWSDRVFETPTALRRWLHARGAGYGAWAARHPVAAATVEHRTPPVAAHRAKRHAARVIAPAASHARRLASTSTQGDWTRSIARDALLGLLLLAAGLCTCAAVLPLPMRRRFPAFAERIGPYRDLLGGGAVALVIGLVVGVALS